MKTFVRMLSSSMMFIAGGVLVVMTVLTLADVVLRYLGRPIAGAYELVAFMGVAVAGFSLPGAAMKKTHVYVDIVVDKLPAKWHRLFRIFTRLIILLMFLAAAYYFIAMGKNFVATHTVTPTLRVPFYPVVFAMAVASIAQCLVCIYEILDEKGGPP